jgi:zinc transporter ZupT
MSQELTKEELIKRYVSEVKRRLGKRTPDDLDRELESLLCESFESRESKLGRKLDLQEAAAIIRDFGDPQTAANRYNPRPNYLIGPGVYPAFIVVMKVLLVFAIWLPILHLLGAGLASGGEAPGLAKTLASWFSSSFQIFFQGTVISVLIFALLDRVSGSKAHTGKAWDPLLLRPLLDPDRVSRTGTAIWICFITLLIVVLNFYPDKLGVYRFVNGKVDSVNLGTLGVHLPLWAINLWWLLTFTKDFLLLRDNRWRKTTRWMHFASDLIAAGILYWVLRMVSAAMQRPGFAEAIGNHGLANLFAGFFPTFLVLSVLVLLVISVIRLLRLLRTK